MTSSPGFLLVRDIWHSRIGRALQGLIALQLIGILGLWALGRLHKVGLLDPPLPPGDEWSLFDCFYFTTIALTTAGFGETLSHTGSLAAYPDARAFSALLLLCGMIATAYFLSSATAFFVEGDLKRVLARRRMEQQIARMSGHFIVCGIGQTGRHIADELRLCGKACVIVDDHPEHLEELPEEERALLIEGDATRDETLREAGIERAAGLAAVLADDKDNLFLTITARQLNPNLRIVSKAIDLPTQSKLLRAGADAVVSPNFIGGLRIASELIRPSVVSFIDAMVRGKNNPVRFGEARVGRAASGKTLRQLDLPRKIGLVVVALRPAGRDEFVYNPGPDTRVEEGWVLVVMGDVEKLSQLSQLVSDGDQTVVVRAATTGHERAELERRISDRQPGDRAAGGSPTDGGWARPGS